MRKRIGAMKTEEYIQQISNPLVKEYFFQNLRRVSLTNMIIGFLIQRARKKENFARTSIDEDSGLYNYADGGELKDWKYKRFDEGWIDGEGYIKIVELDGISQAKEIECWKYKDKFEGFEH